ncbi:DNA methyltransferase [Aquimarina macrocephali]|uniref:DNA methyltransferase n=1 Tax=Aquimarina macrocephali TaxID=666563 RepID=UPI003F66EF21
MLPSYIKLFKQDRMFLMQEYENNHFDIAPVDPEYGIKESSKNHKSRNTPIKQKNGKYLKAPDPIYQKKTWDNSPADSNYGKELFRVSKNQIVFGGNFFDWIVEKPFQPPRRNEFENFIKKHPIGWIIWDKCNGNSDQFDCELIWTSFNKPTFIYRYMWAGMMQGSKMNGEIVEGNKKLYEKRVHPTQKPTKIYDWLLLEYANKGDKILDTGIGSGSIAISVDRVNKFENMNLELTACENDIQYFHTSKYRIYQNTSQTTIFQLGKYNDHNTK